MFFLYLYRENRYFYIENTIYLFCRDMDEKNNNYPLPDFSTLSGIMEYFHKVPFDVFKAKLNEWFITQLPEKRPDLIDEEGQFKLPKEFNDLMASIFLRAEEKDQARLN
jgi:hypothetical protein